MSHDVVATIVLEDKSRGSFALFCRQQLFRSVEMYAVEPFGQTVPDAYGGLIEGILITGLDAHSSLMVTEGTPCD